MLSIDEQRYDRVVLVLTPAFILSQYLLFVLMHHIIRWRPTLNADSVRAHSSLKRDQPAEMTEAGWRNFSIDASQLVWSGFFHLVYGSAALVAVSSYVQQEPARSLGDKGALLAAGDVEYVMVQESAAFLGSIFAALMLMYLFYWVLGWDKGLEQLFHHVTFFGVTLVLARRSALPHSGLWAMAMEASSPALNAMNLLRQLDGSLAESFTMVFFGIFVLLFFALRCVLFGRVVIRTSYLRFFSPDGFPLHVPAWETDMVILLWIAGWLLQLYWLKAIYDKVRRKLGRGKPAAKKE